MVVNGIGAIVQVTLSFFVFLVWTLKGFLSLPSLRGGLTKLTRFSPGTKKRKKKKTKKKTKELLSSLSFQPKRVNPLRNYTCANKENKTSAFLRSHWILGKCFPEYGVVIATFLTQSHWRSFTGFKKNRAWSSCSMSK